MDEQKTNEEIQSNEQNSGEQESEPQSTGAQETSAPEKVTEGNPDTQKKSDFPGEEIEHPSIKETTVEKTEEIENVKPVIIEWKKPFFIMFGLGVAAIILMLVLK
jgi:hypothetical protein